MRGEAIDSGFGGAQPRLNVSGRGVSAWLARRGGGAVFCFFYALYAVVFVAFYSETFVADGAFYHKVGLALADGHFGDAVQPELVAPGYPVMLAGLATLGVPLWVMKGVNVVLAATGVLFVFLAARRYLGNGGAWAVAAMVGLHPVTLRWVPYLMTEPLALCLAGLLLWAATGCVGATERRWGLLLTACVALGLLQMTKPLFAYASVAGMVLLGAAMLVRGWQAKCRRALWVLAGGLLLCVPYLGFTYSKTGEVFYWASNGGMHRYWITNPAEGELGDWHSRQQVAAHEGLRENHGAFIEATELLPPVEREAAYAAAAAEQLKANPEKVARNVVTNVSRLVFGFPRSYENERLTPHVYVWTHVPALLLLAASFGAVLWWNVRVPGELLMVVVFAAIYAGGSCLVPALPRYLLPVLPALALWLAFVFGKLVRVRIEVGEAGGAKL